MGVQVERFDGDIVLYRGDCREILPTLKDVDAVVTDPPYGENMGYDGDKGYRESVPLLQTVLGHVDAILPRNGHVAFFWTMRGLDKAIEAAKTSGLTYRRVLTMYIPKGGARPYKAWLPRTQPIILAQKYLPMSSTDFHSALATYLADRIDASGLSRAAIARVLGCDSRLVMKWSRVNDPSWCLPTPRFYPKLKEILDLDDRFDVLLEREPGSYSANQPDYRYQHDCYVVEGGRIEDVDHPSPKPISVIQHIAETLTPNDGRFCDPFLGSGTAAIAAWQAKRPFVGIEINQKYFDDACLRLEREIKRMN